MDLADIAHELYGLLPGDFTAERNQRAKDLKADGDAELAARVRALGKPTTAAWLVNQLVRHHDDEVEQVAQVGAALREAQERLEKDQVLQLNKQRHVVLRAVTRQARALAKELGNPVSTAIADEVEQTLRAVMSDPDAAAAVRAGTLLRSLSGTGFGAVDLTEAVAAPDADPAVRTSRHRGGSEGGAPQRRVPPGRVPPGRATPGRVPRGRASTGARAQRVTDELADRRRRHEREENERERERQERERAERALAEARLQADQAHASAAEADDALAEAQASVDELHRRQTGLEQRLADLEDQVTDAQHQLTAVRLEHRTAERGRDEARHESEAAHRALDRARQRLERLT